MEFLVVKMIMINFEQIQKDRYGRYWVTQAAVLNTSYIPCHIFFNPTFKILVLDALRSVRREKAGCSHDMVYVNDVSYEKAWKNIVETRTKCTAHGGKSQIYLTYINLLWGD